eukprot:6914891-Ditylum_brightwellii.AAC.1
MQKDLNQDMEEMKQRWAIRNDIRYDKYLSKPNATVISNDEHQEQRHQDHDAANRIQRIVHGFINCRHQHLARTQQYQDAATKFQALI